MKFKTTLFCLLFIGIANAQLLDFKNHIQAKYSVGTIAGANYQALSFSMEWHSKKKFGLLYNLDFINRDDNIKQVHAGVGTLLGPPIFGIGLISALTKDTIKSSDLDLGAGGILLGILMFILPDGVSYHFPVSNRLDLAPYLNFLGVDHVRDRNIPKNYFKYSASLGAKLSFITKSNISLGAFFEARGVAGYGWSVGGGLGIGYLFNSRNKSDLAQ
jgi:hypothetical protein